MWCSAAEQAVGGRAHSYSTVASERLAVGHRWFVGKVGYDSNLIQGATLTDETMNLRGWLTSNFRRVAGPAVREYRRTCKSPPQRAFRKNATMRTIRLTMGQHPLYAGR